MIRISAEKATKKMGASGVMKRSSGQPRAHSLNRDLHAARVFNALPVVFADNPYYALVRC
jgi:hypothetical protein